MSFKNWLPAWLKKTDLDQGKLPENLLSATELEALNQRFIAEYQKLSDPQAVFDLCKAYADQGASEALYLVALMYEKGDGAKSYPKEAADAYWRAAKQGKAEAQYNLGLMCTSGAIKGEGKDSEPDMVSAVHWFEEASQSGIKEATYNLASCYDQGLGCVEDKEKAFKLFMQSSEQGFTRAWHNIAVMFYMGEGVQQDLVEAYAWLLLAARAGLPEAIELEPKLTAELEAEQATAGKARLTTLLDRFEAFLPNNQPQYYSPN